jgi:hypothetical protein
MNCCLQRLMQIMASILFKKNNGGKGGTTFHKPKLARTMKDLFQGHHSLRWEDQGGRLSLWSALGRYSHLIRRPLQGLLIQETRR